MVFLVLGKQFDNDALKELLKEEFGGTTNYSLACHICKIRKLRQFNEAANDPSYPQAFDLKSFLHHFGDNKFAKTCKYSLFFAIRRWRSFLRLIGRLPTWLLAFRDFLKRRAQGQNDHYPTFIASKWHSLLACARVYDYPRISILAIL